MQFHNSFFSLIFVFPSAPVMSPSSSMVQEMQEIRQKKKNVFPFSSKARIGSREGFP